MNNNYVCSLIITSSIATISFKIVIAETIREINTS